MGYDINTMVPRSGRMIKENGTWINLADLLGGDTVGAVVDVNTFVPTSGRMIREDGSVVNVAEGLEKLIENGGHTSSGITAVDHGVAETTLEIPPNEMHVWGEVAELTITLAAPTNGTIVNEYSFVFVSGATPTVLSLPAEVKGVDVIEPNSVYEISIVDNRAAVGRWDLNAQT